MNALTHQTRIALNLIVDDDTGSVTEFLTALTALIALVVAIAHWVKPVVIFAADLIEAANFSAKVLAIGVNALAFGLGVRL